MDNAFVIDIDLAQLKKGRLNLLRRGADLVDLTKAKTNLALDIAIKDGRLLFIGKRNER